MSTRDTSPLEGLTNKLIGCISYKDSGRELKFLRMIGEHGTYGAEYNDFSGVIV